MGAPARQTGGTWLECLSVLAHTSLAKERVQLQKDGVLPCHYPAGGYLLALCSQLRVLVTG